MKLSNKKLSLILVPVSAVIIFLMNMIVKKVLSKNDTVLMSMRTVLSAAAAVMAVILIVFIIIAAVKSLKKKKNCFGKGVIITAALSVIFCASTYMLINEDNKYFHTVNVNWDMHIPGDYKEVYYKENTSSVLGNGLRFTVFKYENLADVNKAVNWTKGNNVTEIQTPVVQILDNLEIQYDKYPDFNNDYKYFHKIIDSTSDLYLIMNEKTKEVYIIENLA